MKKWINLWLCALLPVMAITLIIQAFRMPEVVEGIARGFNLICEMFLKVAGL